jgi:hypothetical protein
MHAISGAWLITSQAPTLKITDATLMKTIRTVSGSPNLLVISKFEATQGVFVLETPFCG